MRSYGVNARPFAGEPLGGSALATTCLRALADIGRPLHVRELLARLNPRPAQGDRSAWAARHAQLQNAVEELASADLVQVYGEPTDPVLELSDRDDVRSRITG